MNTSTLVAPASTFTRENAGHAYRWSAPSPIAKHSRRGWRIDRPNPRVEIDGITALLMALDRLENQPAPVELLAGSDARRPCIGCGALLPAGSWCPICQPRRTRGRRLRAMRAAYVIGRSCAICGAPAEHLDHVAALSRGGTDHPSNLQPLCANCNLRKSDR